LAECEVVDEVALGRAGPIEQLRAGVMSIVNTLDAVISRKSSISVQHQEISR